MNLKQKQLLLLNKILISYGGNGELVIKFNNSIKPDDIENLRKYNISNNYILYLFDNLDEFEIDDDINNNNNNINIDELRIKSAITIKYPTNYNSLIFGDSLFNVLRNDYISFGLSYYALYATNKLTQIFGNFDKKYKNN